MGTAALEHDFTALKSLRCNSDPVLGPLLLLVLYTLLYNRLGEKILDYVNTKRSSKKAGVGAMNTGNMYPKEGNQHSGSAPIELETSRQGLGNVLWDKVLKDIELEHF